MQDLNVKVLLVDDDDIDVRVVQRAFQRQRISNEITVARDGREAIEILRGSADHYPLMPPYLVLLDLNMPRMNGIEFLNELRADPRLHQTPVFVLTTSSDERDIDAAYGQHVAGYLLKSEAGRDFMNFMPLLDKYLVSIQFPCHADAAEPGLENEFAMCSC